MFILSFRQTLSWADAAAATSTRCVHTCWRGSCSTFTHEAQSVHSMYSIDSPDESRSVAFLTRTKETNLSLEELQYVLWTCSLSVETKEIVHKITAAKPEQLSAEHLLLKCGRIPVSFEKQWDGCWRSAEDVLSMFRRQSWNKKLLIKYKKMDLHYFSKARWKRRLQGQLSWSPAPLDARLDKRKVPFCHKKQSVKKMPPGGFPSHNYRLFWAFQWNRVSMFSISRVVFAPRRIRDIKPRVEAAADRKQLERPLMLRLKW